MDHSQHTVKKNYVDKLRTLSEFESARKATGHLKGFFFFLAGVAALSAVISAIAGVVFLTSSDAIGGTLLLLNSIYSLIGAVFFYLFAHWLGSMSDAVIDTADSLVDINSKY